MTRGLVLEGGGAKGAFTFGCLLAVEQLAKAGIKIDVVAGTSVGALNAMLWSTNSLEEGRVLWETISPDTSYRPRLAPIIRIISQVLCFQDFYWERITGMHDTSKGNQRNAFLYVCLDAFLCAGNLLISAFVFLFAASGWRFLIFLSLTCMAVAMTSPRRRMFGWLTNIAGGLVFVLYVIYKLARNLFHLDWSILFTPHSLPVLMNGIGMEDLVFFFMSGGLTVIIAAAYLIGRSLISTAYDAAPLRAVVAKFIGRRLTIPTLATTATQINLTDPDEFVMENYSTDDYFSREDEFSSRLTVSIPHYHRLPECLDEDGLDMLMASAALPFGIVKAVPLSNRAHIDGGLADNLPLWPLVAEFQCDELIIVRLTPSSEKLFAFEDPRYTSHWRPFTSLLGEDESSYRSYWQVVDRKINVSHMHRLPWPEVISIEHFAKPPTKIPFREPPAWPKRIITIAPTEDLGGILSTMNMNAEFTGPLVEKGRLRAIDVLSREYSLPRAVLECTDDSNRVRQK